MRQIEVKGCDRDVRIGHSLEICILSLVKDELSTSDPIVLFPSWIYLFYDRTSIVNPFPLLRDLILFDFLFVQIGNVDIEKRIL